MKTLPETIAALLLLWPAARSAGQEWTRFRGPNGSGVGDAASIPVRWTGGDFNWRVKLPGAGHSSPVLWGRRIFVTSAVDSTGERIVSCLNADDGKSLWSRRFPGRKHRKHSLNSFASATPAVDKDRVYICWASPVDHTVQAFDHAGQKVWQADLGPFQSSHGAGVSPIVYDGKVIVGHEHGGDSSLVALDAATGKSAWRVARRTKVTFVTPCVYQPRTEDSAVIFTNWRHGITAVDPANGRTRWEISVFDQKHLETAISSPIVYGQFVLGTCGYLGYATHTVAVRPDRDKPGTARVAYRVDRGAPLTTTPIVANGLLILWADEGIVTCVDAESGKLYWRKRVGGKFYGSPVAVRKRIYCVSTAGRVVVLAASKEYRLLARNPAGEGSHSTPAIAGGRMYVRTFSHLISLGGE